MLRYKRKIRNLLEVSDFLFNFALEIKKKSDDKDKKRNQ